MFSKIRKVLEFLAQNYDIFYFRITSNISNMLANCLRPCCQHFEILEKIVLPTCCQLWSKSTVINILSIRQSEYVSRIYSSFLLL